MSYLIKLIKYTMHQDMITFFLAVPLHATEALGGEEV
jgi:hypothetical protein